MRRLLITFLTAFSFIFSVNANSDYPNGPVKFIVPWPPGDFEDILTRMIAEEWKKMTDMSATVENRPGESDGPFPGALEVLNAPANGSVIGSFVIGVPLIGPLLNIGIKKDSFEPVGIFLTYPFVLATSKGSPYKNLDELASYAINNNISLGHFGKGLIPTKVSLVAAKKLGFEFSHESSFNMLDCETLFSGKADVINTTLLLLEPCLEEINVLAIIGKERISKLPNVKTVFEQTGINNIELWNGLFVKKGTPQAVKDKIASIASKTIRSKKAQNLMKVTGARVYWENQVNSVERIAKDRKKLNELNEILNLNVSKLSKTIICKFASNNGKWASKSALLKYVKEAKRRNLSCGLPRSTQIPSSSFTSNLSSINNKELQQAQAEAQVAKQLAQQAETEAKIAKSETEIERKKRLELEQQLAALKSQQKQKQQQISQDNQIPIINAMAYNDTDTNAIIQGIITDNVEVAEVMIDNQLVSLNTDGSFQTNLYIPRNGKTVEIVAFDLKGNKAVKTIQLNRNDIEQAAGPQFASLNPSGKRVKPNPNALALIIGVADYKETPAKAMYADSDAQIFYDYATLKLGVPTSNITELVNEGAEITDILLSVKKNISRSVKQDETDIYIFFAGHGLASDDGEDMYLLPYDGSPELLDRTAILRKELYEDIAYTNPRSVTVFLDTCYSGTTRGTDMLIASRPIAIVAKEQAIPDNFTVFTAAAGDQTAKPLEEAKHGLFSYFLMKGMEGEADSNNDNTITASELHAYVQQNVIQQSSGSQTPELQGDANRVLVRFQ